MLCCFYTTAIYAQNELTIQSDSVYKNNNVKARHWYSGTNRFHEGTTNFDHEGTIVSHMKPSNFGFTENTTYYIYNLDGKLTGMVDSIKTRAPNDSEREKFQEGNQVPISFYSDLASLPTLEVFRYELTHDDNELIRISKFDPNESLVYIDSIKNQGSLRQKYWFRKDDLYKVESTEYISPNRFIRKYGWTHSRGRKYEWDKQFEFTTEDNRIQTLTHSRSDGQQISGTFLYDDYGLLIKTESELFDTDEYNLVEFFKYEYYE